MQSTDRQKATTTAASAVRSQNAQHVSEPALSLPGSCCRTRTRTERKSNARKVCAAIKRVTDWLPALCNLEFLFEFAANFLFPNKKIMPKIFEVAAAAAATPLQDVPLQKLFKSFFCGGREVKWYRFSILFFAAQT